MASKQGGLFFTNKTDLSSQIAVFFVLIFFAPFISMGVFFWGTAQHELRINKDQLSYTAALEADRLTGLIPSRSFEEIQNTPEKMEVLRSLQKDFEAQSKTGEFNIVTVSPKTKNGIQFVLPNKFAGNDQGAYINTLATLLAKTSSDSVTTSLKDYRDRSVLFALKKIPKTQSYLVLKKDLAEIHYKFYTYIYLLTGSSVLLLCLYIYIGFYLNKRVIRPILTLTRVARHVSGVDDEDQKNEVRSLSAAFKELHHTLKIARLNQIRDEALLTSIGEGLMVVNTEGKISLLNDVAKQLLGVMNDTWSDQSLQNLFELVTESGEQVLLADHPISVAIAQKLQTKTDVFFLRTTHQKQFPIRLNVAPVLLDEQLIGVIVVFEDITKEKEISRMKSEYISIASHQLRTPLATLKWYAELLAKESAFSDQQKLYVERVNICTKRMISLVDDFLTISRIEQGRMKNEPVEIDLNELIHSILDLSAFDAQKKGVAVTYQYKDPRLHVTHDLEMMREVLSNLISNAIKYAGENGTVSVLVRPEGEQIRFQVTNTGVGIPKQEQSKIFGKFFRAENMVKSGIEGTGLGLYTAKQLIEGMGGTIGFSSEENALTVFWVDIPLK